MEIFYKYNNLSKDTEWTFDKYKKFDCIKQESFFNAIKEIKGVTPKDYNLLIYTDYDTDGLTSGLILKNGLESFFDEIIVISNDAYKEGYNMQYTNIQNALNEFTNDKKVFFMSADTGITDISVFDDIKKDKKIAKSFCFDHHENHGQIPAADFVIDFKVNNKEQSIDFEYCTAGLVFTFCYYLALSIDDKKLIKINKSLITLAAIATIADMVPLTYGNFAIVQEGFKVINSLKTKGFCKENLVHFLLKENKYTSIQYQEEITSDTVSFKISPVLNSAKRITGKTDAAIQALEGELIDILALEKLNVLRKKYKMILAEATQIIYKDENLVVGNISKEFFQQKYANIKPDEMDKALEAFNYAEGSVGIIASDLLSKYNSKVAFCGTMSMNDKYNSFHGSLRGQNGVSIVEAMNQLKSDYNTDDFNMVNGGGHAAAAGINLKLPVETKVRLTELLTKFSHYLAPYVVEKPLVLNSSKLTKEEIEAFTKLPVIFGMNRKSPIFKFKRNELKFSQTKNSEKILKTGWDYSISKTGSRYFMPWVIFNGVLLQINVHEYHLEKGFSIFDDTLEMKLSWNQDENGKFLNLTPAN